MHVAAEINHRQSRACVLRLKLLSHSHQYSNRRPTEFHFARITTQHMHVTEVSSNMQFQAKACEITCATFVA